MTINWQSVQQVPYFSKYYIKLVSTCFNDDTFWYQSNFPSTYQTFFILPKIYIAFVTKKPLLAVLFLS